MHFENYSYINTRIVDQLHEQLFKRRILHRLDPKLELSVGTQKIGLSLISKKEPTIKQKLDKIIKKLEKLNQIGLKRPEISREYDLGPEFFREKIIATKLMFEKAEINKRLGLDHLVVWIADPNPDVISQDPIYIKGSFLYLVETDSLKEIASSCHSGRSALQLLANFVQVSPLFAFSESEQFGEGNHRHPIKKIEEIGARKVGEREIETVYKKVYFSDEQRFIHKHKRYRCNDFLAYPLFIECK